MSDLTVFLLARIAEDEAVAREATPGPWLQSGGSVDGARSQPVVMSGFDSAGSLQEACDDEDAAHIARHDPTHVLAECEAKRRIVAQCVQALAEEWHTGYTCSAENGYASILDYLAMPYVDHPDYRQEWKP